MNDKANLEKPHSIRAGHWLAMTAALLGWMFDGFEMGLYPLVAKPAFQELLRPSIEAELRAEQIEPTEPLIRARTASGVNWWNSWATAMFLFGAATGGLVFGWLGDRIGRKQAMILSVLAYAVFTGLGGFATAAWHLVFLRFIAALGMGGEWSLGVALVMEIWPAWARPYLAGVIGAAANVGFLVIAVIKVVASGFLTGESSWRPLMFVCVTPAFLAFFISLFVPESERWRAATAADRTGGRGTRGIVSELFGRVLLARTMVAIGLASVALLATWGAVQWLPLWASSLNGATRNADAWSQIYSALGAIVGTIAAAIIAGYTGRRVTYFALCVLSLAAAYLLFRPQEYGTWFLALVFLVGLTTASFYGWFPLYFPELFPTRVRATGQGLAYNFGRIFAGAGNLALTGPLLAHYHNDYAKAMAAVTLIYLAGMVLIWFAPETLGKPLPE